MTEQQTQQDIAKQRAEEILKEREGRSLIMGGESRFPQLPVKTGFKTHWFNDEKGKIETALKNGWTFSEREGFTDKKKHIDLKKHPHSRIRVRVGEKTDLSDLFAYAMDIPKEIYDIDQSEQQKRIDKREHFITTGKLEDVDKNLSETSPKVQVEIKSNFTPD